jgi:hypothetical protein
LGCCVQGIATRYTNPDTYEGEFFHEDGLPGDFVIDLTKAFGTMEVEDDDGDEVDDERDVKLLEKVAVRLLVDAPSSEGESCIVLWRRTNNEFF